MTKVYHWQSACVHCVEWGNTLNQEVISRGKLIKCDMLGHFGWMPDSSKREDDRFLNLWSTSSAINVIKGTKWELKKVIKETKYE